MSSTRTPNLATDPCIPFVRKTGGRFLGKVADIASSYDEDPVVGIGFGAETLDAYTFEFLVSALTTAMPPADEDAWRSAFASPPSVDAIQVKMDFLAPFFGTDVFMQDLRPVPPKTATGTYPVRELDISAAGSDEPGGQPFATHRDVGSVTALTAGLMTYAYQSSATSGGRGRMTTMRGGGPMSVFVLAGETLWQKVWSNVLTSRELGWKSDDGLEGLFPWIGIDRYPADKHLPELTPQIVHRMTPFWQMPRSLKLVGSDEVSTCGLTGALGQGKVVRFVERSYGFDYLTETFDHPFSAYSRKTKSGPFLPMRPTARGVSLRDVHAHAFAIDSLTRRSKVARQMLDGRADLLERLPYSIWNFGFVTNKAVVNGFMSVRTDLSETRPAVAAGIMHKVVPVAETILARFESTLLALGTKGHDRGTSVRRETTELGRMMDGRLRRTLSEASADPQALSDLQRWTQDWFRDVRRAAQDRILVLADVGKGFDPEPLRLNRKKEKIPTRYETLAIFTSMLAGHGADGSSIYADLGIAAPAAGSRKDIVEPMENVDE